MNLYKNVYRIDSNTKYMLSVSFLNKGYATFMFELVKLDISDKASGTTEFFLGIDDARILGNHILNYKVQFLPFERIRGSQGSEKVRALSVSAKDQRNCSIQIKNGSGDVKNGIRVLSRVDTNYFYNCTYDELVLIFHKINSYIHIFDCKSFDKD